MIDWTVWRRAGFLLLIMSSFLFWTPSAGLGPLSAQTAVLGEEIGDNPITSVEGVPLSEVIAALAPEDPLNVLVGIFITQITDVDQQSETFDAVVRIRKFWRDEQLAFDAEEFGRPYRTLSGADFVTVARDSGLPIPVFIIENQMARSFSKFAAITWFADGRAVFSQEIILKLQAPDFDFRRFPFDKQTFFVRVLSTLPESFINYSPLPNGNGMGDKLGEEEWVINSTWNEVDVVSGIAGFDVQRYSFGFSAERHLVYYWTRIFIPLLLLIGISWANLFLEEYRRRIDIAGANLLAFIAFNFTISGELPRLGYLTFLDTLLLVMFLLSALTVAYNVMLRRLAVAEREATAKAIDWHMTYYAYPLIYAVAIFLVYRSFF